MDSVYVVSGVRTAIGTFGGSLKDCAPAELGALVLAEAVRRAGLIPDDIEHVVMGQVIQTEPRDVYSPYLEQLDAQRGLLGSELALAQLQADALVSRVQFYQATGGAWDALATTTHR